MNPILKNTLAVLAGIVVGAIVNMAIVMLGISVIPLPEGVELDAESMKLNMDKFTAANYIFPFIAHAIGTLVGAYLAAKIAASHHLKIALVIGVFFLLGGIKAVSDFGGPTWFIILDLVFAYVPMAWLGAKIAKTA